MIFRLLKLAVTWQAAVFLAVLPLIVLAPFVFLPPFRAPFFIFLLLLVFPFMPYALGFGQLAGVFELGLPINARTLLLAGIARMLFALWIPVLLVSVKADAGYLYSVAALATLSASLPSALRPGKPHPSLRLAFTCFLAVAGAAYYLLRLFPLHKIALTAALLTPLLWTFTWLRTPPAFDLGRTLSSTSTTPVHPLIPRSHFPWLPLLRVSVPKLLWLLLFVLPLEALFGNWLISGYVCGMFCSQYRGLLPYGLPISKRALLLIRLLPIAIVLLLSYIAVSQIPQRGAIPIVNSFRLALITASLAALCMLLAVFGFSLPSWHLLWRLPRHLVTASAFACILLPLPCWLSLNLSNLRTARANTDQRLLFWLDAHLPAHPALLALALAGSLALAYALLEWQSRETEVSGLTAQLQHSRPLS